MKAYKARIVLLFILSCSVVSAQVPKTGETLPLQAVISLLAKQADQLKQVEQINYKMRRDLVLGDQAGAFTVEYSLLESFDGKFKCVWDQTETNGKHLNQSVAFDGNSYQVLNGGISTMFVHDKVPANNYLHLDAEEFLLSPFWFVAGTKEAKNNVGAPSLAHFVLSDPFEALLSVPPKAEWVQHHGESYCKLTFLDQADRDGSVVTRNVLVRKADGYPIAFENLDSKGRLLSRYTVEKIGYVSDKEKKLMLPYPQIARQEFFGQGTSDKPLVAYTYTIEQCSINDSVDDSYSFDIGNLEQIYDEKEKILIKIPK